MAVEWTITIEGKNEFGDVCRKAICIDKSWHGYIARSQPSPIEALPTIDRDIRAVRWRLWHGRVDRAIRDLERFLTNLQGSTQINEFLIARLHSLGLQLLTYIRSNRGAIVDYGKRHRTGLRVSTTRTESAVFLSSGSGW